MRRRRPLIASSIVPPIVVAVALTACGRDGLQSDAERFCGEAIANRDTIVDPPLDDDDGVQATLDFYRTMGQLAPLAISEEWNALVISLETAAALEPGDPDSEQLVVATAYATEPAAFAVKTWLERNCGLDIPITTIAPQQPTPTPTTTESEGE